MRAIAQEGQQQRHDEQGRGYDSPRNPHSGLKIGLARALLDQLLARTLFWPSLHCLLHLGLGDGRTNFSLGDRRLLRVCLVKGRFLNGCFVSVRWVKVGAKIFDGDFVTIAAAKIGRGNLIPQREGCSWLVRRFGPQGAQLGHDGLRLGLALAQGGEIVADCFLGVDADLAGVGADETLVENATGELVEALLFQRLEHAGADFSGVRNGFKRNAALLALFAEFFPELSHVCSAGRRLVRPFPQCDNHRLKTTVDATGFAARELCQMGYAGSCAG